MKNVALVVLGMVLAAAGHRTYNWLRTPAANKAYTPTAPEVPLTVDFEEAAKKRVHPDNYPNELSRIETELQQLAQTTP